MEGPLQETRLADSLKAIDDEIRAWGRITRSQLVGQVLSLGLEGRALAAIAAVNEERRSKNETDGTNLKDLKPLHESINYHIKREKGEIERVSIRFSEHGFYVERGVGKYRLKGSASAAAAAKPWLAPILPQAVEALADRLADGYADLIASEASLIVPGLIDTKISK